MQLFVSQAAVFVVAALYLIWRTYDQVRARRERTLRQRVAYMLWVMAQREDAYVTAELE
jgi:hypothetical protein